MSNNSNKRSITSVYADDLTVTLLLRDHRSCAMILYVWCQWIAYSYNTLIGKSEKNNVLLYLSLSVIADSWSFTINTVKFSTRDSRRTLETYLLLQNHDIAGNKSKQLIHVRINIRWSFEIILVSLFFIHTWEVTLK